MLIIPNSQVGWSSSSYSLGAGLAYQRKIFTGFDRTWVFYSNGANLVYKSTPDHINWTAERTIRSSQYGQYFSIWFDGQKVHYVFSASLNLQYCLGTPNLTDFSITWGPAQTIANVTAMFPTICMDSFGFLYVAYGETTNGRSWLTKSSTNNGIWTTEFTKEVTSTAECANHVIYGDTGASLYYPNTTYAWETFCVPMNNGKIYVGYCQELVFIYGKVFDGTNFGSEELIINKQTAEDAVWCLAAAVDTVYLAAHCDNFPASGTSIYIATRTSGWGGMVKLGDVNYSPGNSNQCAPAVSIWNGIPFVFWWDSANTIANLHCSYLDAGSWKDIILLTGSVAAGWGISSSYESDTILGVVYTAPETAPRSIFFTGLDMSEEPPPPTEFILTVQETGTGSGNTVVTGTYPNLRVEATASSGSHFAAWSGAATGMTNPVDIYMDSDKTLVAHFELDIVPPPPPVEGTNIMPIAIGAIALLFLLMSQKK